MKHIAIFILSGFAVTTASAQWITQSAEGKGSFLFKGTNVAIDLAKTDFSFTINNLNNPVKLASADDNRYWFYGAGINAKSEEGLASLFSKGDFVPAAKMNGYLGLRFSNSYDVVYKEQEAAIAAKLQLLSVEQLNIFKNKMQENINTEIGTSSLDPANDAALIQLIRNDWSANLKAAKNPKKFLDFLKGYLVAKPAANTPVVANIINTLMEDIKSIVKLQQVEIDKLTTALIKNRDGYIQNRLWRFSLFGFGGIDGSSFKRVETINTTVLSESFIKEEFRGGNFGIGLNYQIKRWKFGATYAYRMTNNFNMLDKTDYKLTSTTTSGTQTLTQEKAVTAYSGTYGKVEVNELNVDVLYSIGLGKTSEAFAMINPYLRSTMFTRNKTLLPGTYNLGLGTYFFTTKSKFLGGLYLELPDVNNTIEKRKPDVDQNIRPAIKRLTFGIVGRFSLNSLISWQ